MKDFFKKKTLSNYISLVASVFALVMLIVYCVFTSPFGLLNAWAVVCLVIAVLLNCAMFLFATPVDPYFKVIAPVMVAIALGLFLSACAGDIADYFNHVAVMGTGAPFNSIVSIAICLLVLVVVDLVVCFLSGKKSEK